MSTWRGHGPQILNQVKGASELKYFILDITKTTNIVSFYFSSQITTVFSNPPSRGLYTYYFYFILYYLFVIILWISDCTHSLASYLLGISNTNKNASLSQAENKLFFVFSRYYQK